MPQATAPIIHVIALRIALSCQTVNSLIAAQYHADYTKVKKMKWSEALSLMFVNRRAYTRRHTAVEDKTGNMVQTQIRATACEGSIVQKRGTT